MNFNEIYTEVIGITKRPDKLVQIKQDINTTISKVVLGTDFRRDLVENSLILTPSTTGIYIVDNSTLTNWRKWEYIRPTSYRKPLEKLPGPLSVYSETGCEKTDCYYTSGINTIIKASKELTSIEYGYYAYPTILVDDTDTHWIADISPYLIINGAAAKTFRGIGDVESSRQHETEFKELLSIFISDQKYGVNYG